MTETKCFTYDNIEFTFIYDKQDTSGLGCINEIVINNEYILNKFKNLQNKILFDIGANIGIATIIMAKLNPKSTIYSFEPNNSTFNKLLQNIELNNLTNIKPFNFGLSNINSKTTLFYSKNASSTGTHIINNSDICEKYNNESNIIRENITLINFNEFVKSNNINEIYLLKIDAEGAEYDILLENELLINGNIKNIVGEFHYYIGISKMTPIMLYSYCTKLIGDGYIKVKFLNIKC